MNLWKIALLGDSMTDLWGESCPELLAELSRMYGRSEFQIENHGLSGTRAGYGLWRIANDYPKNGNVRRALSYNNPDIVIVESFAYNHRGDGAEGLNEYRDTLKKIAAEIAATTAAKLIFCVTIPPDREKFVENVPNYFNTSQEFRARMADGAKTYLDAARQLARDENWPLADVCGDVEKRMAAGENLRRFINQSDNIHLSAYGYWVTARVIVRAIDENRLIEEKSEG